MERLVNPETASKSVRGEEEYEKLEQTVQKYEGEIRNHIRVPRHPNPSWNSNSSSTPNQCRRSWTRASKREASCWRPPRTSLTYTAPIDGRT